MRTKSFISTVVATSAFVSLFFSSEHMLAMEKYKWKNRPLLVFATTGDDAQYQRQRQIIGRRLAGFIERDMIIVYVLADSVTAELGPPPGQSAETLRFKYGIRKSEFRTILVGKDGGAKLSSGSPVSEQRIFGLIDGMPMRREEMRRRK